MLNSQTLYLIFRRYGKPVKRFLPILLAIAVTAFIAAHILRDTWATEPVPVLTLTQNAKLQRGDQINSARLQQQPQQQHLDQRLADVAPWEARRPNTQLLIPRRIHHFFSTAVDIPVRLVQEINSWASNHRSYDIYFWDAAYVERTLLRRPEFAKYLAYYWNGTQSRYERDLIARLIILHQYGGISPDINMRSLKEATEYLTDSSCLVAQDRVEKAVFSLGVEALPSTSIIACRQGHHFLSYFLRKVTEVESRTGAVVLEVNSPTFLVHAFYAASAAFDEDCAAGRVLCDFSERVSLAEPFVFMPVMEAGLYDSLVTNCKSRAKMPFLLKEACYNLDANGNAPTAESRALPVYVESWAPNRDKPALPLTKIGPSVGGKRPIKYWSLGGAV